MSVNSRVLPGETYTYVHVYDMTAAYKYIYIYTNIYIYTYIILPPTSTYNKGFCLIVNFLLSELGALLGAVLGPVETLSNEAWFVM